MPQLIKNTIQSNQLPPQTFLRSVRLLATTLDIAVQYKQKGIGHDKEKSSQPRTDQAH